MLFSLHGSHIVEHVLQQKKAPLLFVGGTPAQMFSSYLIQKQFTPEGPVSYPV